LFLLLAVVLGVLATVTTFAFLESSAGRERGPKTTILVAKRDLRAGQAIDPDKDLEEMEIPARMTDLRLRSLVPEHRASYKGQRVNRRILAGTPVMLADLAEFAELTLSSPDSRALSLPVRGAHALSGLLVPGDYVKLFVTRPVVRMRTISAQGADDVPVPVPEASGKYETTLVLPDAVKVLAVGRRLSRSRQQFGAADQYESAGEGEAQQTVTLEVTEAQAKTVLEATGAGQLPLTLVLCPPK